MAALLTSLRLRQLGRTLGRSPWAIVTFVFAVLGALGMLGLVAALMIGLRLALPQTGPDAVVLLGATMVVGWALASLLISADDALAPERFALLPVPAARLLPGVLLAGAIGVGGIGTAVALLLTLVGWSVDPLSLAVAVVLLPLQLVTCLLGGRALTAVLARQLAKRNMRDVVIVVGSLIVIFGAMLVPVMIEAVAALGSSGSMLGTAADVLAWTPLGAAWGAPHAIAAGEPLRAVAQLAIALATVAVLALVWGRDFRARLTAPITTGGGGRVRSGAWLERLLPAPPVPIPAAAIAVRGLRLRFRDPRHLVNVVGVVLMPLLVVGLNLFVGSRVEVELGEDGPDLGAFTALGPMLAPLLGVIVLMSVAQLDTAYDSSALAAHVLSGVSGTDDRAGRALGMLVLFAPTLLVICCLTNLAFGQADLLPASIGATLGTLGIVIGAGSAISPFLPGQTPAPEQSPFGAGSSGGAQALLGALVMLAATVTVGAPAIGTAIASAWIPWLAWVSLALGLLVGGLTLWAGVRIGGRALDRRWPEVLAAVSRQP